jgi:chemotaxis family two-component system sensor kinase Cph1
VALMVRRLEQRLIEATSTEGDWRLALFRNPRTLLQPLEATGAALFQGGEILTGRRSAFDARTARAAANGSTPNRPTDADSPCIRRWQGHSPRSPALTPRPAAFWPSSCRPSRPDYLMWFRKEQLLTVTWAGDPYKPVIGNDPLQLSPRRSFEAWSEIVRGTALPWSNASMRWRAPSAGAGGHHRAGERRAAADRRTPARADPRHRRQLRANRS